MKINDAKIYYNDPVLRGYIEPIVKDVGIEVEHAKTMKESLQELKDKGVVGVGMPGAPDFLDLGRYLFVFLLGASISGVTWDIIKEAVKKIYGASHSKTQKKYNTFSIIYGKPGTGIYFLVPADVSTEELDDALDKAGILIEAFRRTNFSTSHIPLELIYKKGQWTLGERYFSAVEF